MEPADRIVKILTAAGVPAEAAAAVAADAIESMGPERARYLDPFWPPRMEEGGFAAWFDVWNVDVAHFAELRGFHVGDLSRIDSMASEITMALNVAGVSWADAASIAIDAIATYGPETFAILNTGWRDDEGQAAWLRAWHRVAHVAANHGWPVRFVDLVAW
jgi:hypothetical protein